MKDNFYYGDIDCARSRICYKEIEKNLGTMYDPVIGKYILKNWELIKIIISEKSLENVNQAN